MTYKIYHTRIKEDIPAGSFKRGVGVNQENKDGKTGLRREILKGEELKELLMDIVKEAGRPLSRTEFEKILKDKYGIADSEWERRKEIMAILDEEFGPKTDHIHK